MQLVELDQFGHSRRCQVPAGDVSARVDPLAHDFRVDPEQLR
jgi:hypothetical protein